MKELNLQRRLCFFVAFGWIRGAGYWQLGISPFRTIGFSLLLFVFYLLSFIFCLYPFVFTHLSFFFFLYPFVFSFLSSDLNTTHILPDLLISMQLFQLKVRFALFHPL